MNPCECGVVFSQGERVVVVVMVIDTKQEKVVEDWGGGFGKRHQRVGNLLLKGLTDRKQTLQGKAIISITFSYFYQISP